MGAGNYDGVLVQSVVNNPATPNQAFLKAAIANYDLEPDVYSFNFPGYAGKFVIVNGKIKIFPFQKLKIGGGSGGFVITTEEGIRYTFDEIEMTTPKGSSGAPYNIPTYNSAWYLSKVENASGKEVILLNYVTEGQVANSGAFTQTFKDNIDPFVHSVPNSPTVAFPTAVISKRLISIETEKYSVNFVAGSPRLDLNVEPGGTIYSLGGIDVSSRGQLVKRFKLKQSYAGGFYNKYLLLNALQDCPLPLNDGETGPLPDTLQHKFEYENIDDVSRYLAFVDHYNFYTGAGEFTSMLMPIEIYSGGVNRSPVLGGTVQGAMKKITYPTGGFTQFTYEQNRTYDGNNYVEELIPIRADVTRPYGGSTPLTVYAPETIAITAAQTIDVLVVREPYVPSGDGFTKNVLEDFEIVNVVGGTVVASGKIGLVVNNPAQNFLVYLPPGNYYLKATADYKEGFISASLTYKKATNIPSLGKLGGGLRLKSMVTDPIINPPLTTEYSYTNYSGFSSGQSPFDSYSFRTWTDIYVPPSGAHTESYFNIYSSYISESFANALPHYYTSVVEKKIAATDTIFTRHDFVAQTGSFMGTVPTRVTGYKKNGANVLIPITKKIYEYVDAPDTVFQIGQSIQIMLAEIDGPWGGPDDAFDYIRNSFNQHWKYLKRTRDVWYEGADSIVTVTNNSFDLARNLVYTTNTNSNGTIRSTKTKYPESYASGFGAFKTFNVLSPIIEQQIWNKTGSDSVLVSGTIAEYAYADTLFKPIRQYVFGAAGVGVLNNESKTGSLYNNLISDTRYEDRINFGYSPTGRLIRQQLTAGIPISYQWGYAATLPSGSLNRGQMNHVIAEAKNALPTEFYFQNFEEYVGATTGNAHSGGKYYNGDFTANWAVPNARSYEIGFYYRVSGNWFYKKQPYTGAVTLTDGDAIDDVGIYPKDAQLSSFTYYEGVGNRSIIDVSGNMKSFTFDKLNRLKYVKDQYGNIVQQYNYHFKN